MYTRVEVNPVAKYPASLFLISLDANDVAIADASENTFITEINGTRKSMKVDTGRTCDNTNNVMQRYEHIAPLIKSKTSFGLGVPYLSAAKAPEDQIARV